MTWPSSSRASSRAIALASSGGRSKVVPAVLTSPPPRERGDGHNDHDEPNHRHPPCGVEPPEVHAPARLRPHVEPTPPALVGAFHLIFTHVRSPGQLGGAARLPPEPPGPPPHAREAPRGGHRR